MHRRALTAALASATMALGGALASTTVPAQAEDPAPPTPLVVRGPQQLTVKSHQGWVYSTFGARVVARGEHFRVEAKRPATYDGPIQAVWTRKAGDVPLGQLTSWRGLDRFVNVQVFQKGKRIRNKFSTACLNGSSRQIGPGAPEGPANPFPWGCPWNPYTLGSVMGVAQDHSARLGPEWGFRVHLRPGRYRVVTRIAPRWQAKLGLEASKARVSTKLVVEKATQRRRRHAALVSPAQRAATDDLEATTEAPSADSQGTMVNEFAPDLRSLPAFDISVNRKGTALRFGATVWNGGAGPMVIQGFRENHTHARAGDDHADHMTAYQYYFDGNGNQTGYDRVGEFTYHAANHNHWHFEDFARYRLYRPDPNDRSKPGSVAVRSTKASFCLVATDAVDLTVRNADMRPEYTDLGSQCGGRRARMLRQVLANGHGDTYHQFRAGQAFRIGNTAKVPDGVYFIGVEANPDDADGRNLQELDLTNNESYRKVRIGTRPGGKRFVRAFKVGVIDERAGFEGFFRLR